MADPNEYTLMKAQAFIDQYNEQVAVNLVAADLTWETLRPPVSKALIEAFLIVAGQIQDEMY